MTRLRDWLSAIAVYGDRRVLAVLVLGFASGLPLLLTASTLSVRLAEVGVDKTTIGLFALAGLPYTLKFLWAPVIDRAALPPFTTWLGRRRGWAVAIQLGLAVAIVALGRVDPVDQPALTGAAALAVAFLSASQDVVIDAFRVESLEERQYGAGAAVVVFGYRIAILVAGAGALFLATAVSWAWVYAAMAALLLVGTATMLACPEPAVPPRAVPNTPGRGIGAWLQDAVVAPLADFLRRPGWHWVLLFIVLYKFGDALAGVMANPFYVELGFTKVEIAGVSKLFGFGATLLGGFVGGVMVVRWGIMRSLLVCGVLQMLSNLVFAVQAHVGHDIGMLMVTIAVENLAGGMGTSAFVAYLSGLCNLAYTATQYALLSSLMATARTVLASPGGWVAERMDWTGFFVLTTAAAVPGLVLLLWMRHRFPARPVTAAEPAR